MRWGFRLGDEKRYCRCLKWPPLATTQAVKRLVKFATALLMCSCSSSSQMVCMATFNSSVILGYGWSLWYFSAWCHGRDNPAGSNLKSLGATRSLFSINLGHFAFSSFCRTPRTLRNWRLSWLKQYNFIIFRHMLTKLKCILYVEQLSKILCLNNSTQCWNIN